MDEKCDENVHSETKKKNIKKKKSKKKSKDQDIKWAFDDTHSRTIFQNPRDST